MYSTTQKQVDTQSSKLLIWSLRLKAQILQVSRREDRGKPEECTVKQLQRWLLCRGAKTKVSTDGPGSCRSYSCTKNTTTCKSCQNKDKEALTRKFYKLLVHKKHNNLHVLSQFKVAAQLVPSNNPINKHAFSLGTRLSLFSAVSYVSQFCCIKLPQGLTRYFQGVH